MQQQNAIIIRSGVSQNWALAGSNQNFLTNSFSLRQQLQCRYVLARHGLSLINSYYYRLDETAYSIVIVYYRFFQRAKLRKFLSRILRRGDSVLASPFMRSFLQRRLNNTQSLTANRIKYNKFKNLLYYRRLFREKEVNRKEYKLIKEDRRKLKKSLSTYLWQFDGRLRGWGDIEFFYFAPIRISPRKTMLYKIRSILYNVLGERVHISLYNINQFVPIVNPVLFSSYYTFNRLKRYLYLYDLIQLIGLSSKLSLSNLVGQTLAIGIERHETRKIQRRFLQVFTQITDRMVSWEFIKRKPLDWRISIFGRLDAQIRRQHIRIQIGRTNYQFFDNLTSYSLNTAKSKFSTSSVRVWMRNLAHWH